LDNCSKAPVNFKERFRTSLFIRPTAKEEDNGYNCYFIAAVQVDQLSQFEM
jgi:hypothetical protein